MRLIDVGALIVKLNESQIENTEEYKGLGEAKQIVDNMPTVNAVSEEVYTREYNLRKDAEFKVYKLEKAIGEIKERIEEMIDKNTTFDSDNSRAQIIALEWVSEVIDEKVKGGE